VRPAQQVALVGKGVVDGGMDDEKALGRARRFKPLLFSLPSPQPSTPASERRPTLLNAF